MTCLFRLALLFALLAWIVRPSWADSENGLIPFSRLTGDARQVVEEIVRDPTLSREIKGLKFWSRKEVYEYLLDHPDFAAAIARALGLSEYQIVRDAKFFRGADSSYWGTDARGATGHFWVVYGDEKKRIFFLEGTYNRKWLPTIFARGVMVLTFQHKADGEGSSVENDLYGYLKIENTFIALLAKLLQPIMGGAMDRKMKQTLSLGARISEEAYRDPIGFFKKLEGSPELPQQELDEFRRILCPRC